MLQGLVLFLCLSPRFMFLVFLPPACFCDNCPCIFELKISPVIYFIYLFLFSFMNSANNCGGQCANIIGMKTEQKQYESLPMNSSQDKTELCRHLYLCIYVFIFHDLVLLGEKSQTSHCMCVQCERCSLQRFGRLRNDSAWTVHNVHNCPNVHYTDTICTLIVCYTHILRPDGKAPDASWKGRMV